MIMLSVVWLSFVGINVAAAITDLLSYRIPNALVLALLVLFLAIGALNVGDVEWLSHIGASILVLGVGVFLYAFNQMGAGDVKLLSTLALWAGIFPLVQLLFFLSIFGLAGMLVIVLLRIIMPRLQASGVASDRPSLPRILTRGQGIPYGIAIGPAAIAASFSFVPWLWQF